MATIHNGKHVFSMYQVDQRILQANLPAADAGCYIHLGCRILRILRLQRTLSARLLAVQASRTALWCCAVITRPTSVSWRQGMDAAIHGFKQRPFELW
jgi:hypothetical protein